MGLDITVHRFIKVEDQSIDVKTPVLHVTKHFPEWTKEFQVVRYVDKLDFDKYKEETGVDLLKITPSKYYIDKDRHSHCVYNVGQEPVDIDMHYFPRKPVAETVIYYTEVGYQRRGVNKRFYDDCRLGIVKSMIWTKAELEDFMEKYCDDTPYYDCSVTNRENFKTEILDKFEEGKSVVSFL